MPLGRLRLVVWTFFENPRSSVSAKVLSIVSAAFVLCSLAGLILASMKEFQLEDGMMTPVWPLQLLEIGLVPQRGINGVLLELVAMDQE